ncbi:transcription-repair coupling factor [Oceanibacterium hippocampi]|uniref:Transcription-repair-coupling factor n=1 Tax=Oceanibacterium hippocampi TaxID=745714 RepID=A0A1Y5T936_9PROT|nr:transcription-repair coupling factor [Oceanibacterium hippocampi]SLN55079.1 Transcription-repair-coupling factor [Oceanibacterium hippocampi]
MVLKKLDLLLSGPGRWRIDGVAEGFDARLLAEIAAAAGRDVLYVVREDTRMAAVVQALRFFAPGLDVLVFPAWDCQPYDRVSPRAEISARRMEALSRLLEPAKRGRVLVTTVNAALQRVPPRDVVQAGSFPIAAGSALDQEALKGYLGRNGFERVGTVTEAGQYAVRGGLIDVFPPGSDEPLRLDLFGDHLENLRRFDPLSQRTSGSLERFDLVPAREFALDDDSIARFRQGYRELFGSASDDPLYEAISEGRAYAGMEHWLPLFHERLETLFDYVPEAVAVTDHLTAEAREARHATIADHFASRSEMAATSGSLYRPLPPEALYLDDAEWNRSLGGRVVLDFSPYAGDSDAEQSVVDAGGRRGRDFAPERKLQKVNIYDALRGHVDKLRKARKRVLFASYSGGARTRLAQVLRDHEIQPLAEVEDFAAVDRLDADMVALAVLGLEHGFETDRLAVITEQDVLGDRLVRPRSSRRAENFIAEASQLNPGDLVVHIDHGIGRYEGLRTLDISGAAHDCLLIEYDGGDKLYVPVENIEMLSRYGSQDAVVALDKLGGAGWQARKARLKERVREIADNLIRTAAERELRIAPRIAPPDGIYQEFCARFPFEETEDQQRAINDIQDDLARGKPMDRLVCGDVGFGKTEVALRAAFVVAMSGRQVAVIAPTTLLARQHFKTFRERFAGLPVNIAQLSRLVGPKEARETRKKLESGELDIIVGTHALLGKSVAFRDLGLMIVDEEQHFGVSHKERLKQLRADVHVLTLTATPIPRTLQLAMSGLKELSLIATPPVDRLAVRTFVLPFDPVVIREALLREHYRGGQSFYVCPRIADLAEVGDFLRQHVPEVKFVTAHGQMPPAELETVMNAFYDGAYDVLVSTNIVESGLDIPTANTLIVHRSDMYGLAQLYQLRGRIGRAKLRAYAYLSLPPRKTLTEAADRRLRVLQSLDGLGAGFTLASHDLDIRGGGNLLGEEQSGHIREVGFELYQQMLEEAVAAARAGDRGIAPADEKWAPAINLGTAVLIPETYVSDLALRLGLYRRVAALENRVEIDAFAAELIDRFGPLPDEVEHLLQVVTIKRYCREANIEKLEAGPKGATLAFRGNSFANPGGLVAFISQQNATAKLRPDHTLVYMRQWPDQDDRLKGALYLVRELAKVAAVAEAAA